MRNYLDLGNWNCICDSCGRKFKALDLKKRWDGLLVCQEDYELRHESDFLRVQKEKISVPFSRPYPAEDVFTSYLCSVEEIQPYADIATADCARAAAEIIIEEVIPTDPYFVNVVLLLHGDGANGSTTFTDSSPVPKALTVSGNAQISTAQSKFGGASMAFDGDGDRVLTAANAELQMGTGDFTFEMFVRPSTSAASTDYFFSSEYSGSFWFTLSHNNDTSSFKLQGTPSIGNGDNIGYPAGVWYHIAYCRAAGVGRFFIDGVQKGSTFAIPDNIVNEVYIIGGASSSVASPTNWFNGHIDEVRITKGVARYTADFTPPVAPFPDL